MARHGEVLTGDDDSAPVPSIAVVVSTFDNPEGLESCLLGLRRQSTPAARVVVADDGSGPATRHLIERYASELPLEHVWQPDEGFRLAAARNRASVRCREDYLVFLDGDTIPHRRFLADHVAAAARGRVVLGQRCALLGYRGVLVRRQPSVLRLLTLFVRGRVINDSMALDTNLANRITGLRKGIRLPRRVLRPCSFHDTHGGNLAVWREDFLAANGFDERFVGWGLEDWDFTERLVRLGRVPYRLLFQAVCFHLDAATSQRHSVNRRMPSLEKPAYCAHGVDQYLA